jgi:hypothetical protein
MGKKAEKCVQTVPRMQYAASKKDVHALAFKHAVTERNT